MSHSNSALHEELLLLREEVRESKNKIKQLRCEVRALNKHAHSTTCIPEVDVICLTGGKSGSTTLFNTFQNNGYKCIKIHNKEDFKLQFGYDGLIDLIDRSQRNKELFIIDAYRTPIERKISSFFENIHIEVPSYKDKSCEELIDFFNTRYLNTIEEYHSINPIMEKYGVELFDTFDYEKKYVIKKKGNLIFIKLLFSNINNWGENLSEIFNKKITINSENKSSNKEYYSIYNKFKLMYKTTKFYINNILKNDKEFKIFNTPEQQDIYINKYLKLAI